MTHQECCITLYANALKKDGKSANGIDKNTIFQDDFDRKNLVNFLSNQRRIDEALLHYNKVLLLNPEDFDAHYKLGSILAKQGKVNEAMSHFAEVIRINPDYAEAYYNIGVIFSGLKKFKEASEFFSKAVQIDPDYKEARDNLLILKKILNQDEK